MEHCVTVIIVAYNSEAVIAQAVESVRNHAAVADIIVVDNASRDDTRRSLSIRYPNLIFIENTQNHGFGRANNQALAKIVTPFALLLNPDAALCPGALDAMLQAMVRYPEAGLVAPVLIDTGNTMLESYKRNVFARERDSGIFHPPAGDLCAEFLSGAVWLARMEAWRATGFFNESLFLFYEDDDMCLRLRESGYSLVLAAGARALHMHGKSTPYSPELEALNQYHLIWSRLYIEHRYHGDAHALRCRLIACYISKWIGALLICRPRRMHRNRHRLRGAREGIFND